MGNIAALSRFQWEMDERSWKALRAGLAQEGQGLPVCRTLSDGVLEGEEGQGPEETDFGEVITNGCLMLAKQNWSTSRKNE